MALSAHRQRNPAAAGGSRGGGSVNKIGASAAAASALAPVSASARNLPAAAYRGHRRHRRRGGWRSIGSWRRHLVGWHQSCGGGARHHRIVAWRGRRIS
jgi:hypothetical protein